MPSNINPDYPEQGKATVASVRTNFLYAKTEIEALQDGAGGAGVICRPPPAPPGPHVPGTLWVNEDTLAVLVWNGSGWEGAI